MLTLAPMPNPGAGSVATWQADPDALYHLVCLTGGNGEPQTARAGLPKACIYLNGQTPDNLRPLMRASIRGDAGDGRQMSAGEKAGAARQSTAPAVFEKAATEGDILTLSVQAIGDGMTAGEGATASLTMRVELRGGAAKRPSMGGFGLEPMA